jgi:adenine-specific DNA-methyltransferase
MNFNNPYNRADFLNFLETQFLPDDFLIKEIEYNNNFGFIPRYLKNATKLGSCPCMELDVFEIIHTSTRDARVGVAQDAFRLMLHKSYNNRALIIFKQEDSPQYRFSLLQIEAEQADNSSRITRSFSNPRRYSFLLGENAHVKTPTQFLIEKGKLTKKEDDYFNDLQERFSVEILTKLFYKELSDWYFWALKHVEFPSKPTEAKAYNEGKDHNDLVKEHKATNVIRMLTRILFVWFIKQKGLIPEELFDEDKLKNDILTELNPIKQTGSFSETGKDSVYYKAILQNLFFASLNCPIKPQSDDEDKRKRGFRRNANYGDDFGNDWLFRYRKYFKNPDDFVELINSKVPFLNGGLFECLDDKHNKIYIDGFTDNLPKSERLIVPDYIFFGRDENVDLSDDYGEETPQTKQASVKGLINILKTYNFTVEENTPAEVEVALDPELLGKVFENLLASFNPETKTTARKQTGSFYTPREIVNYMVDESLIAYFKGKTSIEEKKIRPLFQYTDDEHNLSETQVNELIDALYHCKILDPACGSGAFPMGILQKLVHLLQKVDPENYYWKKIQHEKAQLEIQLALDTEDKKERENRLIEINNAFDISKNRPDYARKLFLIENCIYGVDIQPIATQISKLRFFISLVVDQNNDTDKDNNFGIIPLPNLETKFVTANTLIGINRPGSQLSLFDTEEIQKLQEELRVCRHKIFSARTKKTKQKYRKLDKEIRMAIADELKNNGWGSEDADNLASWDPYDQNSSSPFFDPEWMFGLQRENGQLNSAERSGYFDIVIGNPPYIKEYTNRKAFDGFREISPYYMGKMDIWYGFACHGIDLLTENGVLCFIAQNNWTTSAGAKKMRNKVITDTRILQLVDFNDYMVFGDSASIQTMVMFFRKNNQANNYLIDVKKLLNNANKFDLVDLLANKQTPKTQFQKHTFLRENYINKLLTFSGNDVILDKIKNNKLYFNASEIAQGIVFPQDFLNKKNQRKLGKYNIGDGIFGLSEKEKSRLNLSKEESKLIKPYFTTEQIQRYYTDGRNKLWLIYTNSKYNNPNSLNKFPKIKQHLDKFISIITSDNKPYGLHRAREERFFIGEKIISQRKCVGKPVFSYSSFDCYVTQTFYIIKTLRWNMKFLTGLLNSKLVAFWLRYRGKMQGENFQVDKEPLLNIPLPKTDVNQKPIISLVNQILETKKENPQTDTSEWEDAIDQLVYQLYGLTDEEIAVVEG